MRSNTSSIPMSVLSLLPDASNAALARSFSTVGRLPSHSSRKAMRLPELFAGLALLASGISAHADPVDLKPFRANYLAEWKGMTAASSTIELKQSSPDTYTYSSVNTARGLFRMAFPDALTQISTFKIAGERVVPVTYRGVDEKERPIELNFDWEK